MLGGGEGVVGAAGVGRGWWRGWREEGARGGGRV